jgi:hypothetical protein
MLTTASLRGRCLSMLYKRTTGESRSEGTQIYGKPQTRASRATWIAVLVPNLEILRAVCILWYTLITNGEDTLHLLRSYPLLSGSVFVSCVWAL